MPESSLDKMLSVLDFVERRGQAVSVEEMLESLPLTRLVLDRSLKALTGASLLAACPDGRYTLGPRVIELEYKVRIRDPLVLAGDPPMTELVQAIPGIALLCLRYRNQVMCVHQVRGAVAFASAFERGVVQPLLKGAASRVILANLPSAQVGRLYLADPDSFVEAQLGDSLRSVRSTLRAIRRRGWESSESEAVDGVTAVAAPIFEREDRVVGSLSLSVGGTGLAALDMSPIVAGVVDCARRISQAVSYGGRAASASRPARTPPAWTRSPSS
jgi:DNA-binding IclR family transcriptional regulator